MTNRVALGRDLQEILVEAMQGYYTLGKDKVPDKELDAFVTMLQDADLIVLVFGVGEEDD